MRSPDYFDRYDADEADEHEPVCKFCGSTDVRWRQQGGHWVLFSSKPGVTHNCRSADADEFQPTED